jgi:hypothetical protein
VAAAGDDVPVPDSKAQFAEPVKSPNHNMTERKEMLIMQAAREAALPTDIIRVDPGSTNLPQVVASLPDDKTLGARKLFQTWSNNTTAGQRRKLKQAVGTFTLINNPDLGEPCDFQRGWHATIRACQHDWCHFIHSQHQVAS